MESSKLDDLNDLNSLIFDSNQYNNCLPTISIVFPNKIIDNVHSKELRAYLIGQIARTCSIFKVDEIVIFTDKTDLAKQKNLNSKDVLIQNAQSYLELNLKYLETPQYLRKLLFPISNDLSMVGLMNPIDAGHHLRSNEYCKYREGAVLFSNKDGSKIDIGLKMEFFTEERLKPKSRVTVKLDKSSKQLHLDSEINFKYINSQYKGILVSSMEPKCKGLSWGYKVRSASSFSEIIYCPFNKNKQYDLVIGTGVTGISHLELDLNEDSVVLSKIKKKKGIEVIKNCLIVFGNFQSDDGMSKLIDLSVNTCIKQGTKTIKTEEALIIGLSVLKEKLKKLEN